MLAVAYQEVAVGDGEPEEEGWGADLVDEDLVEVPKEYPEPAREVGKVVAAGNQEAAKTC